MDDMYDRVIFQLQILGKIREQDRLYCTQYGLDVCGPSKLDFIYRSWHGETRSGNISIVKEILSTAFALIESLLNKAESYSIAVNGSNNKVRRNNEIGHNNNNLTNHDNRDDIKIDSSNHGTSSSSFTNVPPIPTSVSKQPLLCQSPPSPFSPPPARYHELEQTRLRQRLDHLQSSLRVAGKGLYNWSRTYKYDMKTVQQIENIVKSIEDNMVQIDISRGYICNTNDPPSKFESTHY